jgi:class 3 adenylate cyclase
MQEPQIRYARTSDGVNIAYYQIGEGRALVHLPPIPFRHLLLRWQLISEDRSYAEACVRRGRSYVQFDPRGLGLSSSHGTSAFSLDAFVGDLEAVVGGADLDVFDILAVSYSCPVAIKYATIHPERVSHMILIVPVANMIEALDTPAGRAVRALRSQDWDVYTESSMHVAYGWAGAERSKAMTAVLRGAASRENGPAILQALDLFDVTDLLTDLAVPTLAIYPPQSIFISADHSRSVAASIPAAALMQERPFAEMLPIIDQFLGTAEVPSPSADDQPPRTPVPGSSSSSTAIILFADIVDSTALTEHLGDAVFREKTRELDGSLRAIIRDSGGTPIDGKLLGDGVLATFSSASQAIAAALACGDAGDAASLPLHLGLHAGDVIREADNVFGGAVNIASRVSGLSGPGEVLVSQTVRDLARTSARVSFEDRGEQTLKGVGEVVRVWAVRNEGVDSQMA